MSTFTVPVVKIEKIEKHPNADTLSITEVEGCPVIFQTAGLKLGDLAIYVPVDAVVPLDNPEFKFLATKDGQTTARVKAKKLRGIFSMGILMPLKDLWKVQPLPEVGQDTAEALGITKYEEPEKNVPLNGPAAPPTLFQRFAKFLLRFSFFRFFMRFEAIRNFVTPKRGSRVAEPGFCPVYDMESYRKYKGILEPGERVVVTEKIHGCNARFAFRQAKRESAPRLHIGSHYQFKPPNMDSVWHQIAEKEQLATKLADPLMADRVLYGEVYGKVQDLNYGSTDAEPLKFAAFDIFDQKLGKFLNYDSFKATCALLAIPTVPVLYDGPYQPELVEPLAEGQSVFATAKKPQIKEGVVIKTVPERFDRRGGRVILKLISEAYMLRKGGTEFH